jgi:hypothetical protein
MSNNKGIVRNGITVETYGSKTGREFSSISRKVFRQTNILIPGVYHYFLFFVKGKEIKNYFTEIHISLHDFHE